MPRSFGIAVAAVLGAVAAMTKENKKNEYLQGFRFRPPAGDQGDRDKPFGPAASGRTK